MLRPRRSQLTLVICQFIYPKKADAKGLISCANNALQVFGIGDVLNKDSVLGVDKSLLLVSGGTDGASVNVAAMLVYLLI